jgi:hypothetical protein
MTAILCGAAMAGNASQASPGWNLSFSDAGSGDWSDRWFVEGDLARVDNTPGGMIFASGPTPQDSASHAVLWTAERFAGDVRIEYDFTRLDDMTEATSVNIIYIQATGTGADGAPEDIRLSSEQRRVPLMKSYFLNMNLLHISYAATGPLRSHYIAARRYPAASREDFERSTLIQPVYENVSLFEPGDTYHITVIKEGGSLVFTAEREGASESFRWDISAFPLISKGRIGFRQMWARRSRYANIKIYTKEPST